MNNKEIINKETKELFEWIGHFNHDLNQACCISSTPSNTEREAIIIACNKMLNEARADERQQLAKRMKLIDAQSTSLTKAIQEDIEFIAKLKKETAEEIFEKLDALCSDTGVGLGLDLEDALSNNARDSDKFRQTLHALKKKMRIE